PQPATTRAQGLSTVPVDGEIHDVVNPGRGGSYTADGLPYGLGPRVPMTVVSPWTKGGFVCSQVFDHTSVIRFIAARFGVDEPNITPWRRAVCGDLTSAFDFRTPDATLPPLPDTSNYRSIADQLCSTKPAPSVPAAPSPVDPQEPGVRPARALPYELHVNATVHGGARLRIEFANRGEQGAHFYVYASNRSDGPWRYTVGAHRSLHDEFDLGATNGAYAFTVYGPNGFVRVFEGRAAAEGHGRHAAAHPEVKAGYDVANGNLYLKLTNHGGQSVRLTLADNAYGAPPRQITLRGGDERVEQWALAPSHHWYDVTVSDGATGQFVRRFAGHVENGKSSYSDPAAVAPVTG
ncbi:phospholipase domain-containing protein, partial [Burkholderia thailandensis]